MLLHDQSVTDTVMPRVAQGGDDVAVSPAPRHFRLERRIFLSRAVVRARAGVRVRNIVPVAPAQP